MSAGDGLELRIGCDIVQAQKHIIVPLPPLHILGSLLFHREVESVSQKEMRLGPRG